VLVLARVQAARVLVLARVQAARALVLARVQVAVDPGAVGLADEPAPEGSCRRRKSHRDQSVVVTLDVEHHSRREGRILSGGCRIPGNRDSRRHRGTNPHGGGRRSNLYQRRLTVTSKHEAPVLRQY
jgi:hypothetical protein